MRTLLYESSDNLREVRKQINQCTDFDCVIHVAASPFADINVHDWDQPKFHNGLYRGFAKEVYPQVQNSFPVFVDMYCRNFRPQIQNLYRDWTYHHYLNTFGILVEEISRVLVENSIEVVLLQRIPHLGSDYLLYTVAHSLGLRVILMEQCLSLFGERFFIFSSIDDFGLFLTSVDIDQQARVPEMNWGFEHRWDYMGGIMDFDDRLKNSIRRRAFPRTLISAVTGAFRNNVDLSSKQAYVSMTDRQEIAYLKYIAKNATDRPSLNQPFIYFPLQLQPEMTTSALGGDYVDQALALERLTDILPKGWRILVKENPKQTHFMRDEAFFCRLRRLESVTLIHPRYPTAALIKKSRLVVTITGTAGWESLLGGKPVLVFGKPWYRSLEGVFKFSSSVDLDELSGFQPRREEIQNGLLRILRKTGSGRVYGGKQHRDLLRSEKNAVLVADALQKYLRNGS